MAKYDNDNDVLNPTLNETIRHQVKEARDRQKRERIKLLKERLNQLEK